MFENEEECIGYTSSITVQKPQLKERPEEKSEYFVTHFSHPRLIDLQGWGDTQLSMPGLAFTKVLTPYGGGYAFDITLSVKKLWK